jgi:hypothetical protein
MIQMGIAQSDWQDRAGLEHRRQLYARPHRRHSACRVALFPRRRPADVSGVTSKAQADAKNERSSSVPLRRLRRTR